MGTPFDNSPRTILTESAEDALRVAINTKLMGNSELWAPDDDKLGESIAVLTALVEVLQEAARNRSVSVCPSIYRYFRTTLYTNL